MKKCPQCGKELDDNVKFCTGCGTPLGSAEPTKAEPPTADPVQPTAQAAPATEQPASPPKEKKPIDYTMFDKCFWVLYVVFGALSYLCVELGSIYTGVSTGFTVFLGVLSLVFVLGFVAIAVVRKLATMKESEEDRKKHALRDNICLAVSAVMLIFVLIGAIGLFNIVHDINELSDLGNMMGGMF